MSTIEGMKMKTKQFNQEHYNVLSNTLLRYYPPTLLMTTGDWHPSHQWSDGRPFPFQLTLRILCSLVPRFPPARTSRMPVAFVSSARLRASQPGSSLHFSSSPRLLSPHLSRVNTYTLVRNTQHDACCHAHWHDSYFGAPGWTSNTHRRRRLAARNATHRYELRR